tara:strand:- start:247 stop:543 length:297 start_codon:yes stop_codon:yes gene_type:complete
MAKVKGTCSATCKRDFKACWHKKCEIVKVLVTGKFLVINNSGFIRAAVPADLDFSESELEKYQEYDLTSDQLGLDAQGEREILRWKLKEKIANNHPSW